MGAIICGEIFLGAIFRGAIFLRQFSLGAIFPRAFFLEPLKSSCLRILQLQKNWIEK